MDRTEKLNRWEEYNEDLFYDHKGNHPEVTKPIEGPPILEAEVERSDQRNEHRKGCWTKLHTSGNV